VPDPSVPCCKGGSAVALNAIGGVVPERTEPGDDAGADRPIAHYRELIRREPSAAHEREAATRPPPAELKIGDETFRVVRTDDPTADFGMAAVRNPDGTISGVHVTDDVERAGRAVRAGRIVDPERHGDLGPGLYMSSAPQLWMARARNKWSFLDGMGEGKRAKLAAALRTSLADRGGLLEGERDFAHRLIDNFEQSGNPHAVPMLADQPYAIQFWKPEYLAVLAITPGPQPQQVPVTLRGHFAESPRGLLMPGAFEQLKAHGVDGVFVRSGMASYPQLVVWNPNAVVGFGSTRSMPDPSELVASQAASPEPVDHGSSPELVRLERETDAPGFEM
jgi:hypothetical protein